MTRRLVIAMTLLVAAVALALAIPIALIVDSDQRASFVSQLEVDTLTTASLMGSQPVSDWPATALGVSQRTGSRVVVVDEQGVLVADSDQTALDRSFDRPEISAALSGTLSSDVRYSNTLGVDLRYVAAPIVQDQSVVAAVRLSLPESAVNDLVWRTRLSLGLFVLAVVIAAALIAWVVAYSIAAPLRDVAAVADGLSDDLELRAEEDRGPREVRSVARALNRTAQRLSAILHRQERVAADASHHLRTPLTGVRLRLEAIEDISQEETVRTESASAIREVDRLSRRIEQILALARSDTGQPAARVDVEAVVRNRSEALRPTVEARGLQLEVSLGAGPLWALAAPGVIDRVVDELVGNASSYARSRIGVDVVRRGDVIHLSVDDDGPGVPEEDQARIFERFARGQGAEPGGSGLGLALVRESAQAAGGNAVAEVSLSGGLRVTTSWPAAHR